MISFLAKTTNTSLKFSVTSIYTNLAIDSASFATAFSMIRPAFLSKAIAKKQIFIKYMSPRSTMLTPTLTEL